MQRKLVKQGNNALTVTLPHEWIKAKSLHAGDIVEISFLNESLQISSQVKETQKEVEIDVEGMKDPIVWHSLQSVYIKGFDRIIVHNGKPELLQSICDKGFTGFIVELQTTKITILQSVIKTPEDSIDAILKRIYFMFNEVGERLCAVKKKDMTPQQMHTYALMMDKHILYCMRYLEKYDQLNAKYPYFLLLTTLEEAADILTLLAKHVSRKDDCETIKENINAYIHALMKKDYQKVLLLLRKAKEKVPTKTFTDGLVRSFYECLYNFGSYLVV